jgi:hypothetical protein
MLLLAVVVVLVWAVARIVGGGGDDEEPPSDDASPAAAEVEPTEPTDAATDDPTAEETDDAPTRRELREARQRARRAKQAELRRLQQVQDVSPALDAPVGPCDLTQVQVLPAVPSPAYAGTSVPVQLGLRTDQPVTCSLDLDPQHLLLAVSADGTTVWSTSACRRSVPRRSVVLRPHWTSTVTLEWSGQRTGARCSESADFAVPGSYELQAAVLTGEPASVEFELADPAPVDDEESEDGSAGDDEESDNQRPGDDGPAGGEPGDQREDDGPSNDRPSNDRSGDDEQPQLPPPAG